MHGHLAVGIVGQLRGGHTDGQSGADVFGKDAGANIAYADSAGGLIQTAGGDLGLRGDAQQIGHLGQDSSHQLAGFTDLGQEALVNAEIGQHFGPVLLGADIPVFRGGQQGTLGYELAGELINHIILQQKDMAHLGK